MDTHQIQEKFFRHGRLTIIPKKLSSKQVLFSYLRDKLGERGQVFTEKEVNAFLAEIYDDFAILRRYLVDYGYLTRDDYGREYKIAEER
ncbi:DUF2087 domain-containing protein [Streptococcus suis]|uniref:DUF2087 domain-containing protein n=1 Tax=Streptococcus suis TaxID=1307 RepID=UPI0014782AE2